MNKSLVASNRIKSVFVEDKKQNLEKIERIIKSECLNLFRNYFELNSDNLNVNILINEFGQYDLQINAISKGIKFAKSF